MAQILEELNRQLQNEDKRIKKYAEDCLVIAKMLMKLNDGVIYERDWRTLVTSWFDGAYVVGKEYYKPTRIGEIFIKGIKAE